MRLRPGKRARVVNTRAEENMANVTNTEGKASLMTDGLMSVGGACQFLGLGRSSVYKLMDEGSLPYCKIGGARRIPRRALIALADRALVGGRE
jgi:excisionase family DNA binding protein